MSTTNTKRTAATPDTSWAVGMIVGDKEWTGEKWVPTWPGKKRAFYTPTQCAAARVAYLRATGRQA